MFYSIKAFYESLEIKFSFSILLNKMDFFKKVLSQGQIFNSKLKKKLYDCLTF